jgi:hypothetical protein
MNLTLPIFTQKSNYWKEEMQQTIILPCPYLPALRFSHRTGPTNISNEILSILLRNP